jgi:hypothetical protein
MDELMGRFVLNMKRNESLDILSQSRKILDKADLRLEQDDLIEEGVTNSMHALIQLMQTPLVDADRQPNTENKLYLK